MSAINTAVSGLQASVTRLNVAAANTVNQRTRGPVPPAPPETPQPPSDGRPQVYQAVETVQASERAGGVRAETRPIEPSYLLEFDPDSAMADEEGVVAAPNVDLVQQVAEQVEAQRAFAVNLSVIRTADEMERSLLDMKA